MASRRLGLGVLAAWALPALAIVALWNGWLVVPDRWNPWAPLWPRERPNLLTRYKLQRLASDPLACAAALRATTLVATPVPDRALAGGCGWHDAVRVQAPASGGSEGSERRSEHATANALDVARFTLADGTSVSVARDWQRGAPRPARPV